MDSVFIIMQMICNCTTTSHIVSPSLAITINRLQNCVADLQIWFKENQMIMNDEKTEFITFIPKRYEYLVEHSSIIVGKISLRHR